MYGRSSIKFRTAFGRLKNLSRQLTIRNDGEMDKKEESISLFGFSMAVIGGNLTAAEKARLCACIAEGDFEEFHRAAANDDPETIGKLAKMALAAGGVAFVVTMLGSRDHEAFRTAARKGHHRTVRKLADVATSTGDKKILPDMLESRKYEAFRAASAEGHTETVETLAQLARECGGIEMLRKMLEHSQHDHCHDRVHDIIDRLRVECSDGSTCPINSPLQSSFYDTAALRARIRQLLPSLMPDFMKAGMAMPPQLQQQTLPAFNYG